MSLLSELWKLLPKETQVQIQGSPLSKGTKQFSRTKKTLTPSPLVKSLVERLKNEPSAFLDDISLSFTQGDPLCKLFLIAYTLDRQNQVRAIQRRFTTVACYRFKTKLERQRLYSKTLSQVAQILRVSTKADYTEDEILGHIKHLISVGGKYDALTRKLGDGCLFILPEDITQST